MLFDTVETAVTSDWDAFVLLRRLPAPDAPSSFDLFLTNVYAM